MAFTPQHCSWKAKIEVPWDCPEHIIETDPSKIEKVPYQSEKFAASLPQTCSTLFSAPEKLRNSVQKCAASGILLVHNRLCTTESKVVRQNWNCVREVCHNIYILILNKL